MEYSPNQVSIYDAPIRMCNEIAQSEQLQPSYRDIATVLVHGMTQQRSIEHIPVAKPLADRLELADLRLLRDTVDFHRHRTAVSAVNKGMSRVEVSKLLGVHQATVARWVIDATPEPDHL